jgi:hypothetical protein
MSDGPFSVGSGKPTISRVPEGGGGAFRPRPVAAPPGVRKKPLGEASLNPAASAQLAKARELASEDPSEASPDNAEAALWARLAAAEARRQRLKSRSQNISLVSERGHGG